MVPKTTLRFVNLLEFMQLAKSHYIHGYGLQQGKDTHKYQPKEEMHWTESGKVPSAELPSISGCVTLLSLMCDMG